MVKVYNMVCTGDKVQSINLGVKPNTKINYVNIDIISTEVKVSDKKLTILVYKVNKSYTDINKLLDKYTSDNTQVTLSNLCNLITDLGKIT